MTLTPSTMLDLGTLAPDFSLTSTDGNTVSLNAFKNSKALVVMFICNHCPYVIHVKKELISISNDYKDKGIAFVAINSNDPDYELADSFENMKKENYPFPYLFDETQEVAKSYNAACTPDIFIFDADRKLVYRGQIDDSRPGNNKPLTGADLRSALDAVLEETTIQQNQKPSSGCNIKWKSGNEPNYFQFL